MARGRTDHDRCEVDRSQPRFDELRVLVVDLRREHGDVAALRTIT